MIDPAGWIPPEYRLRIYGELTPSDVENIRMTSMTRENGKWRRYTTEEIKDKFKRILGVVDSRYVDDKDSK